MRLKGQSLGVGVGIRIWISVRQRQWREEYGEYERGFLTLLLYARGRILIASRHICFSNLSLRQCLFTVCPVS